MARERKNSDILDIRVIFKGELAKFMQEDSAKDFRSFAEHIRYIVAQYKESKINGH